MENLKENNLTNKQVYELCTAMCLLNRDFLKPLLSGGLEKRYSLHPNIFLNDLKNILLDPKTKVKLGKMVDGVYTLEEDQAAKMSKLLQATDFQPSKDWNWLIKAEKSAQNILTNTNVREVYWTPTEKCTLVAKTDANSVRIFLGKSLSKKYEAEEFFVKLFTKNLNLEMLLDTLTQVWCSLLMNLPEKFQKYLYVWNFKENLTWKEYQNLYSDKHLGEEIPELRFRYKKFSHFAKDAMYYTPDLLSIWKSKKEEIVWDFLVKHVVEILKVVGVEQRSNGYFNPTMSTLFNIFLKEHLETEGYDNFYLSSGGERLDAYNDNDFDGETSVEYSKKEGKFVLSLTSENNKKVEFEFDFFNGEMISEPYFRS